MLILLTILYYFSFTFLSSWGRVVGPEVRPERKCWGLGTTLSIAGAATAAATANITSHLLADVLYRLNITALCTVVDDEMFWITILTFQCHEILMGSRDPGHAPLPSFDS